MGHDQTLDSIVHWQVAVPKDRVIFDEGDASEALYLLDRGCVRLQINGDDGRRQIFAFLFAGDIFGMGLQNRRAASAEAVSPCQLLSNVSHHLAVVTHAPADERRVPRRLAGRGPNRYPRPQGFRTGSGGPSAAEIPARAFRRH